MVWEPSPLARAARVATRVVNCLEWVMPYGFILMESGIVEHVHEVLLLCGVYLLQVLPEYWWDWALSLTGGDSAREFAGHSTFPDRNQSIEACSIVTLPRQR